MSKADNGNDLGPGWVDRITHHEPAPDDERRGPFKARTRAGHAAMVKRASANGHASRRLDLALAALPDAHDEVDEVDE